MDKRVSVVMTSYKRFDLLQQTVNSFLAQNTYPIEKFIIIDDSCDDSFAKGVKDRFENIPNIELIFNNPRLGQIKSIDKAYSLIQTSYLLHSEDDYIFEGNKNFISNAIDILEENPNYSQVHMKNIGGAEGLAPHWIDNNKNYKTTTGVDYKLFNVPFEGNWFGFSYNVSLKRLADYKKVFPNGYAFHIKNEGETGDISEYYCNVEMKNAGFDNAAILLNPACRGVGAWFSTYRRKGQGGIL